MFEKIQPNQLVVAICRGSQFCCVMNGGKLVQNVNGHATRGTHPIYNRKTGQAYEITSTHHQMQYPFNLGERDYEVLYDSSRSSDLYDGDGIE